MTFISRLARAAAASAKSGTPAARTTGIGRDARCRRLRMRNRVGNRGRTGTREARRPAFERQHDPLQSVASEPKPSITRAGSGFGSARSHHAATGRADRRAIRRSGLQPL